jgi:hypothetical protein
MKLKGLPLLAFLLAFLIASCSPPTPSTPSGSNPNTNIEIQITGTESKEIEVETIPQLNCTGSAEVENLIQKSRTIEHTMEVQNGVSINANGQVGFAGTDVELGATVASQFGQSYGNSESITRSITVKTKPGINMQHIIRQVEVWKVGQAKISVGGQQTTIPFKFRSDFAIELVNSQNLGGCDVTPTAVSGTDVSHPQTILLRGRCGTDYLVRANEPIFIYYGGWGVQGLDLAKQWKTALTTNLIIDGLQVFGEQQPPSADLPLSCSKDFEGSYWIYYTTTISGLSVGEHEVTVTFNTSRALSDGVGDTNYEPGQIVVDTLKIVAK